MGMSITRSPAKQTQQLVTDKLKVLWIASSGAYSESTFEK